VKGEREKGEVQALSRSTVRSEPKLLQLRCSTLFSGLAD
jgi:hypothetical protein